MKTQRSLSARLKDLKEIVEHMQDHDLRNRVRELYIDACKLRDLSKPLKHDPPCQRCKQIAELLE